MPERDLKFNIKSTECITSLKYASFPETYYMPLQSPGVLATFARRHQHENSVHEQTARPPGIILSSRDELGHFLF